MQYNSKSLTRAGAALFANADANKQPLIVDKVVVSDKVIPAGTDISTLTLDDFTNAQQFDANNVTQNDNTFTVTSVLSNENLKTDLSLALIGILAHLGTDTSTQTIIGVAIGNEPFVLPAYNGTPFRLVPSISMGFSASQNVVLQVNDDVYITQKDMQQLMKNQGFLTQADIDGLGYATKVYVDGAIKAIPQPDTSTWQKRKLTADDGSVKLVIAAGEDVNTKLGAVIGTTDFGTVSIDIGAKNNSAGHTLLGFYQSTTTTVNATVQTSDNVTWTVSATKADSGTTFTWLQLIDKAYVDQAIATAKQAAIDQAKADLDSEMVKRNVLSNFWWGTQAQLDAVNPKDANAVYGTQEDDS